MSSQASELSVVVQLDPQAVKSRALGALDQFWPQIEPWVQQMLPMARTALTVGVNLDKVPAFLLPAALRANLPNQAQIEVLRQLLQSLQNLPPSSYRDATAQLLQAVPDAWLMKWGPLARWILMGSD